jgi:hypothetical protein
MGKKLLLAAVILIAVAAAIGAFVWWNRVNTKNLQTAAEATGKDETAVKTVVDNFGQKLKNVSLLPPLAAPMMDTEYKDLLAPELLAQWKASPAKAIGRLTLTPWPDKIEITSAELSGSGTYLVIGDIIQVASTGAVNKQPIELTVAKSGDRWLITGASVKN